MSFYNEAIEFFVEHGIQLSNEQIQILKESVAKKYATDISRRAIDAGTKSIPGKEADAIEAEAWRDNNKINKLYNKKVAELYKKNPKAKEDKSNYEYSFVRPPKDVRYRFSRGEETKEDMKKYGDYYNTVDKDINTKAKEYALRKTFK